MKIDRKAGWAPRTAAVASEMSALDGPCVGCRDCRGLCPALIEAMTLPEIVLGRGEAP